MARKSELLVGLDIGTSKVAAIVGEATDGAPNILGVGTAPADGLRKGVVVNIEATVQAIDEALKEAELSAGVEIHSVIASLGGAHIRGVNSHGVIPIKTAEVVQADVDRVLDGARAIPLPSDREILHVLPQDFVLDGQNGIRNPVGMSGVRLEAHVHIITTGSRLAQNVVKCCQRLGLHVEDLVLEPLAAAEAVLAQEEKELGVALVDLGAGTTDVLIFHQGALKHTAVLSVGGNHITSDIAAGLRTPFRDADLLKHRSGYAWARSVARDQSVEVPSVGGRSPRLVSRQALARIIEARVEEIMTLVRNQIVKCGAENGLGSGIVLTGGSALLDGITQLSEQVFQSPVRLGVPLHLEGASEAAASAIATPAFAAAVGLVEYGARPRDHSPAWVEQPGVWRRMTDRMKDWAETFFREKLKMRAERV